MASDQDRQSLARVLREAKLLLDDQRRAIRRADFPELMAIAGSFHRLANQLALLPPDLATSDAEGEIRALREQLARQHLFLTEDLAKTVPAPRVYGRPSTRAGTSLLLDQYS